MDIISLSGDVKGFEEAVDKVHEQFYKLSQVASEFENAWSANSLEIQENVDELTTIMAGIPAKYRQTFLKIIAEQKKANEAEQKENDKRVKEAVETAKKLLKARQKEFEAIEELEHRESIKQAKRLLREQTRGLRSEEANRFTDTAIGSLGGIPSKSTPQALTGIATARRQIEQLITTGKVSEAVMQDLFDQIRRGAKTFSDLSIEERQAESALRRLSNAFDTASTAGKRTQEILLSWRSAIRIFSIQQLHYAITALSQQFSNSSKSGAEFLARIAEIQTISQTAGQSVSVWSNQLVKLSNKFDLELLSATSAAYEAISNQVVKGATSAEFLNTAFEFARTTSSDAMQGVNLLSSAINGFNLATFEADSIAAQFFKTIELGRVRTEQIANIYGNAAPMAHALGVSMAEMNAALTVLTKSGVRPDTSLTLINNVILNLIKPTEELNKLFKEWGVTSGESAIATFGFAGVLRRLEEEFRKGGLTRIGEIAKNMRAIRGEIGLLSGSAFADFEQTLTDITTKQEDYTKGSQIMSESVGTAYKRIVREITNLFNIESGVNFTKLLVDADKSIGGLANNIKPVLQGLFSVAKVALDVSKNFVFVAGAAQHLIPASLALALAFKAQNLVLTFSSAATTRYNLSMATLNATSRASITEIQKLGLRLGLLNVSMAGTITSTRLLTAALATLRTVSIPLAIGIFTAIAAETYRANQELGSLAETVTNKLNEAFEASSKALSKKLTGDQKDTDDHVKLMTNKFNQYIAGVNLIFKEFQPLFDSDEFKESIERFKKTLPEQVIPAVDALAKKFDEMYSLGSQAILSNDLESAKKIFEQVNNFAENINDKVKKSLDSIRKEISSIGNDRDQVLLEKMLFGKSERAQSKILKSELSKALGQGETLSKAGNFEEATKAFERAEKLAQKIASLNSGKGFKDKSAFDLQITVFDKQIELQKKFQEELEKRQKDELEVNKSTTGWLKEQTKNAEAYAKSLLEVDNQYKAIQDRLRNLRDDLKNADAEQKNNLTELTGKLTQLSKVLPRLQYNLATEGIIFSPEQDQKIKDLKKLTDDFNKSMLIGDTKNANKQFAEIVNIYKDLQPLLDNLSKTRPNELFGDGKSLKVLIESLPTLVEESERLRGIPEKIRDDISKNVELEARAAVQLGIANDKMHQTLARFPEILKRVQDSMGASTETINQQLERLKKNLQDIQQFQSTNLQGLGVNANGGLIHGPGGRDNLLIRAHSGERVMNENAQLRFGPTLASMNSNYRPTAVGDTIINVGGINMPITNTNGGIDEITIGSKMRRAVQRGLVKLK